MPIGWFSGGGGEESLDQLIAKRKYDKAIQLLRERFQQGSRDPGMRLQLADVLILAGKGREAVPILLGLADELARAGMVEKAIAALKKVQDADPDRDDVEERVAALMQSGEPPAEEAVEEIVEEVAEVPPSEFDLGFEVVEGGSVSAPAPSGGIEMEEEFTSSMDEGTFDEQLREFIQGEVLAGDAPAFPIPPGASRSPLFAGLAQHELVALIRGLRLRTYEPGDMIVVEGERGDSVYIIAAGTAKVYVQGQGGHNVKVRELGEGAFFGEIASLSGSGRTATVIASTRCEVLELDHLTLGVLTKAHPSVAQALRTAYSARAFGPDEERARRS